MVVPATWVVVAEAGRATIYGINKGMARLRELETLEAPCASNGEVAHAPDASFAVELEQHLEAGRRDGRFEALVLVASPALLVPLRARFSPLLRATLVGEIDHSRVGPGRDRLQVEVLKIL